MSSKMAEIVGCILWNHMGFIIDCTEKNGLIFFIMVMFFVCLCSGNRIHQCMHYFQDYLWLDLIIRTLISYYSHKSSYFGQTFCQEIMK